MSSDSDSESGSDLKKPPRLGGCEVCGVKDAIYACPKCEVKTCSLTCVRIHKEELDCNGIRDRTKFIRMKNMKDTDLLSDYRLLEECARFIYSVKRDEKKKFTRIDKELPIHLYKLKLAARKRGTILQFLTQNFSRHSINTTRYNFKTNIIHWRVEWIFPNVDSIKPLKFVDEKCPEQKKLSDFIDKYLNPNAAPFDGSKDLVYYKSAGFSGVKVLLKAEKLKCSSKKFYELDPTESLAENLSGKCILEFPIIFIVLKDHSYNFEVITKEDDIDYIVKNKEDETENKANNQPTQSSQPKLSVENEPSVNDNDGSRRKKQKTFTEIIAEQKKMEIEKEIKEDKKKKPKNLLFTTGYSSEESLSYSEDEEK